MTHHFFSKLSNPRVNFDNLKSEAQERTGTPVNSALIGISLLDSAVRGDSAVLEASWSTLIDGNDVSTIADYLGIDRGRLHVDESPHFPKNGLLLFNSSMDKVEPNGVLFLLPTLDQ